MQEAYQIAYTTPLATIFVDEPAPAALQALQVMPDYQPGAAATLGLQVVPVNKLFPHEHHNPQRVQRLVERIASEGLLVNPPLVVALPDDAAYRVLDGATRTTAFQQLDYPHMIVQVADPQRDDVHLNTWLHAIRGGTAAGLVSAMRGVANLRLSPLPVDQLAQAVWEHGALGYLG